ncbi:MAG TPA: hypothetical protein VFZ32_05100 [Micromonosporaceae bacterium]
MFEERFDIDLDDTAFTDRLRHNGVGVIQVMQIVHGRYLARRHIGSTVNLYGPAVDTTGGTTWMEGQ